MKSASAATACVLLLLAGCGSRHDNSFKDRLSLAREYIAMTDRAEQAALPHQKTLVGTWGISCSTPVCSAALNRAARDAAIEVEHAEDDQFARILAAHTTSDDLLGAVAYSKSRAAQSIRRARREAADEYATLAFQITGKIHEQFVKDFCPSQPTACHRSGLDRIVFEQRPNGVEIRIKNP
jgi:hypothetical protein